MTNDGTAYATAHVMQHLLRFLEKKGVLTYRETQNMLDDVLDEFRARMPLAPNDAADAHRAVGLMYLPVEPKKA